MQQAQINIPDYDVKRRLGAGGMASVYLARHIPSKRMVALKVMSNTLGEDSVWAKRFIQEAQVIAQLNHPNVVPIHDVGSHDGQFYIAMALLEGGSLKDRMRETISVPEALKIVAGIAAGLDYAAEKGFVHRDIKPDNIMFRDNGKPVILDFGIVKSMDTAASKMTQTGMVIGTVAYMSPEQAQGHELDPRSDIYSLGVLFYELLTGEQPYCGETDVSTILKHISDPIPRLPPPLDVFQPLIDRCLAKKPEQRFSRARDLIALIKELEPAIKAALKKQRIMNTGDITAPTLIAPNEDATVVSHTRSQMQADEDSEDITQVLSSAQATLRDFSVDARRRKAKRTRTTLGAAVVVALMASGYLGYHQWVLVPKERQAAEALLREAELKTERKIETLLVEAQNMRRDLVLSQFDQVDGLIAIYRQVLKLDPDHEQTGAYIEELGERYVALAEQAVNRNNLEQADTYREYAESLVPKSEELSLLRSGIKQQRAQNMEQRLVDQEVETLIAIATEDIQKSVGFSDSAFTKIQQVLRMVPAHPQAETLLSVMHEKAYSAAASDLKRERLSSAQAQIALLEKHYPDPQKVMVLQEKLNALKDASHAQGEIKRLVAQASQLKREKKTIVSNDRLRDIYRRILHLDPKFREAKQGLIATSDFEADGIATALSENDFQRAKNGLDTIRKATPNYANLPNLRKQIQQREEAVHKADRLVQSAEADLQTAQAMLGDPDKHRPLLTRVGKTLEKAKALDKQNANIDLRMTELEDVYVRAVSEHLAGRRFELAKNYLEDSKGVRWPSNRLVVLQSDLLEQSKYKKKKHVITTGF